MTHAARERSPREADRALAVSSRRASRGSTLVEAIAAIVIIATISGLAAPILVNAADAYRGVAIASQLNSDLATTVDLIDRAVREASLNATSDGPAISQLTSSAISWETPDGNASLSLSGQNLLFAPPGESAATMLTSVSALTIRAFDESNSQLAAPLSEGDRRAVRRIEITIEASRQGVTDTLRIRAFVRCMMRTSDP